MASAPGRFAPLVATLSLGLACSRTATNTDLDETGVNLDGDGDPATSGDGDPSTSGDGDGDPSTSADGDGDWACSWVEILPQYTPPRVVFVVEASGSMFSTWDHDADAMTPEVTRWSSVHGAIAASTSAWDTALLAGVQRFPAEDACPNATPQSPDCYGEDACIVAGAPEAGLAFENSGAIVAALPPADADLAALAGAAPMRAAIDASVAHLLSEPGSSPGYLFLITDGAPNCGGGLMLPELLEDYDAGALASVEAAFLDQGIATAVFGVDVVDALAGVGMDGEPEANPATRLDELALAGGTTAYHPATREAELAEAISGVIDAIAECTADITPYEIDPFQFDYITVDVDGMEIPRLDLERCESMDGWAWIEEGALLTLCGSICDDYRLGNGLYEIVAGCPPPW